MKIINAGYEIVDEPSITRKIERMARICYKSENLIKDGSDKKMVQALINREHTAMLEHASVIIEVDVETYTLMCSMIGDKENIFSRDDNNNEIVIYGHNTYLRFSRTSIDEIERRYLISGNMRAFLETLQYINDNCNYFPYTINNLLREITNDSIYIKHVHESVTEAFKTVTTKNAKSDNPEYAFARVITPDKLTNKERILHEDVSVIFTCDRGVSHELVRMRPCSFAQESTRYCNYSHEKFGNEITVINPFFWSEDDTYKAAQRREWMEACEKAESAYIRLLNLGASPEQARDVLPTSVKTEIAMTTNLSEWRHVLNLRACESTGPAHIQMKEIMIPFFKYMRDKYPFAFGDMKCYGEK